MKRPSGEWPVCPKCDTALIYIGDEQAFTGNPKSAHVPEGVERHYYCKECGFHGVVKPKEDEEDDSKAATE